MTWPRRRAYGAWVFEILLAALAGFACGAVNTMAGGGSLISLPVLIYLGLPATDANATNRVAILFQNATAAWSFRRKGVGETKVGLALSAAAVPTALAGAYLASLIPDSLFKPIVGGILLAGLALMLRRSAAAREGEAPPISRGRRVALFASFALLGFYGGFIQAGIGFLILVALARIGRFDLVRANGVKVLVILVFTIPVLALFSGLGEVDWRIGLALGAGGSLGGWAGTVLAIRQGEVWIRRIFVAAVLASSADLLGLFDLARDLLGP
ncbi:MAG: sulfite exporter TauE/SafE family protein [Planctomycetes bacterium]|nr:sulfite exporter TauE/SafE family protein [Planctomycetota bacterium]